MPLICFSLFIQKEIHAIATYVTTSGSTEYIAYRSDPNSYLSVLDLAPNSTVQMNQNYYQAYLQDADLRNTFFQPSSFNNVDFTNANFDGAVFSSSSAGTNVSLSQGIYENVSAVGTDFGKASFWFSQITNADFRFADLSLALDVDDATWTNTLLYGANLGTWTQSDFVGADFTTVPEPSTYALAGGLFVLALALYQRRKRL